MKETSTFSRRFAAARAEYKIRRILSGLKRKGFFSAVRQYFDDLRYFFCSLGKPVESESESLAYPPLSMNGSGCGRTRYCGQHYFQLETHRFQVKFDKTPR